MSKYCVGVDFGSLSARALVADVADGRELAAATMDYPHAVMTEGRCPTARGFRRTGRFSILRTISTACASP